LGRHQVSYGKSKFKTVHYLDTLSEILFYLVKICVIPVTRQNSMFLWQRIYELV